MKTAAAIELLLQLINSAGTVSAMIRKAHNEGRQLSLEEMQAAFDQDDVARARLVKAIEGEE